VVYALASWKTAWVFLVCVCVFILLRSRDFVAVDGAVRCLEVFHRRELFFHANNHLLYPAAIFLWHHLLGLSGYQATTPVAYLAASQLLNAFAAAGCCAIVFRLGTLMTGSWRLALVGTALLAGSRAFLLHATNSAEPMLGLLWSLLATFVLALPPGREGLRAPLAAGALVALAMATYQSMAFILPAVLALSWVGSASKSTAFARLAGVIGGMLCTVAVTYGWSYTEQGIPGLAAKLARFFVIADGNGAFGGISLRNVLLLPLGLTTSLVAALPDHFSGIRSLVAAGAWAVGFALSVAVVATLAVVVAAWKAWQARALGAAGQHRLVVALIVGLVSTTVPPLVWDPLYEKLWLQPLVCVSLLLPVALATKSSTRMKRASWVAVMGVMAISASNLVAAIEAHREPTPYLGEAERVAALTRPGDLVVHEWDAISVLFGTIWGWDQKRHRFDFPTYAVELGPRARQALDEAVAATLRRQGRVFFLGVVDQPPEQWRVFLGGRAGVQFSELAPYRRSLRRLATFRYRAGHVHLYEWSPRAGHRQSLDTGT
jgi:hypothetical protein